MYIHQGLYIVIRYRWPSWNCRRRATSRYSTTIGGGTPGRARQTTRRRITRPTPSASQMSAGYSSCSSSGSPWPSSSPCSSSFGIHEDTATWLQATIPLNRFHKNSRDYWLYRCCKIKIHMFWGGLSFFIPKLWYLLWFKYSTIQLFYVRQIIYNFLKTFLQRLIDWLIDWLIDRHPSW